MNTAIEDAILGCIVGGAIGDAAGAAVESGLSNSASEPFDFSAWRLTDDTQMTLATCEGIIEAGKVDPQAIAAVLLRWFRQRRLSGLGASALKALRDLDAGNHWALAGCKGERAAGNGAAMRIAPLAFLTTVTNDDDRRAIRDVARITHHHDEAYVGALAVLIAIQQAMAGDVCLPTIAANLPDTLVRDRIREYASFSSNVGIADAPNRFGASGYVVESVPRALFAVTRFPIVGFNGMVREIIDAGGDADTNASMACQIVGAKFGFNGLPTELIQRLPDRELVLDIAYQFAKHVSSIRPSE